MAAVPVPRDEIGVNPVRPGREQRQHWFRVPGQSWYAASFGEVSERLKEHAWKVCMGAKPIEGSNPSLSARPRRSSAIPLALLLLALATVFLFGGGRGHAYYHQGPDQHDDITRVHMAVAMNLSPAHGFFGFRRLARDDDGDLVYAGYNRFPVLGHALIGLATLPFPDDASARLAAARVLMLAFFGAAATLAYLALSRLAGDRWVALAATLLAFSSYYALYYNDMVAPQGGIDLFGMMLALHGIAVFAAEGRLGQLLTKICAALLLGWHVYALLLPFVLLGLAAALRGRDWAGIRRHLTLGAVAATFGATVLAANLTQEYLALGGEVAPARLPTVESMLYRAGLAETPSQRPRPAKRVPAEATELAGVQVEPKVWLEAGARSLQRIAWSAPYAVGYFVGDGKPDHGLVLGAPTGLALAALILLATLALLLSPATRHRGPLAALALSGPCWAIAMPNSYFPFEGMFLIGIPLAFFALVLPRLDRLLGGRVRPAMLAGVAVPTFALSSFLMARATAPEPQHLAFGRAFAADVDAIRELVEGKTILVSEVMDACSSYRSHSGPFHRDLRRDFRHHFAGHVFVTFRRRRLADFVVSERIDGIRTVTPDNRLAFLYDRASHEEALRRYERRAMHGAPVLDAPDHDIHFIERNGSGGTLRTLLYVRDRCPIRQVKGSFYAERVLMAGGAHVFVHVRPVDANDLSADRWPFGFESVIDFHQRLSGWRRDGRCYAVCRLPDYDIASIRAGTATRRRVRQGVAPPRTSYDVIWEGTFSPDRAAGDDNPQDRSVTPASVGASSHR